MGLLDDLVKLQFMHPTGQSIRSILAEIRQKAVEEKAKPIVTAHADRMRDLSNKGDGFSTSDVLNQSLDTYSQLINSIGLRDSKGVRQEVQSISDQILGMMKTQSAMKEESARAGLYGAQTQQETIKNSILQATGQNAAEAKIALDKAHASYYEGYWEGQENLREIELRIKGQEDDKKLARDISFAINSNIGTDPELAKSLIGVNIDDYIKPGNIDIDGLAHKMAENDAEFSDTISPEKRDQLVYKYRLKIHESMFGSKAKTEKESKRKELELLQEDKKNWINSPSGMMGKPYPYEQQLQNIMREVFGDTADPVLQELMKQPSINQTTPSDATSTMGANRTIVDSVMQKAMGQSYQSYLDLLYGQ